MVKKKVSKKKRDVNLKNIIVLLVIVLIGLFIWAMVAQGSFDEGEELGAEGELAQAAPRAGGGGGMIHLWKFEGDLNDSIGRADKKEVKGKVEYVPGVVGLAVKLDYNDSLRALNRYLQDIPNNRFTIDFCMKAESIRGNGVFIEKKKGDIGFAVRADTTRVSGWAIGRPDNWVDCINASVIDNQWHHVALTASRGGNKTIWIDGILCAENRANGPGLRNNRNFFQGRRLYKGLLDEEAIWDRVLSNSEIAARANICVSGEEILLTSSNPIKIVNVGGSDYTVELLSVDGVYHRVTFEVNGDARELYEGQSKVVGGVRVYVKSVDEKNLKLSAVLKLTPATG